MDRRPNSHDTEEDLLRFQQQFLSSKMTCGAQVKRPDKRKTEFEDTNRDVIQMKGLDKVNPSSTTLPKKSKIRFGQESRQNTPSTSQNREEDLEEMIDKQDRGLAAVLTDIIERDTRNIICSAPVSGKQAFPSAFPLDLPAMGGAQASSGQARPKRKSLFAQQVEAHSAKHFGVEPVPFKLVTETTEIRETKLPCFGVDPVPLKPVIEKISKAEENVHPASKILIGAKGEEVVVGASEDSTDMLSRMSEQQRCQTIQEIYQTLNPKDLAFLQARGKAKAEQEKKSEGVANQDLTFSVLKERKKQLKQSTETKSSVDLPFKPSKSWLNMSTVERDKLEWMKDLPTPSSTSTETGRPARFDFQGQLLAVDAEIPVNLGLHHHGDEPERAGYTLEELFQLSRSSNLQQRSLALHTLARVISNAKSGFLLGRIQSPIIPSILDGGVVMLLRWALDDSVPNTVAAAIDALHALLFSPYDEEAEDLMWPLFHGEVLPGLTPSATLEKKSQPEDIDEENKEEETDADMIKRDVFLALVTRMELLTRFNFLLNKMQFQPQTVIQMLEILQRAAQHSLDLSYEIFKCKGLMGKIVQEFLPTAWALLDVGQPLSSVYGVPLPAALRLIRVMCQTGRNLAAIMAYQFNLNIILLRYLAVSASDLQLPKTQSQNLQCEALALWRVLASYGQSTEVYFNMYSTVISMLGKLEGLWATSSAAGGENGRFEVGMICLLEKMVNLAGTIQQDVQVSDIDEMKSEEMANPSINWNHVISLYQPLLSLTCRLLQDIGSHYPVKKQNLNLATVCLNFLATFYETESRQSGIDEISRLDDIEKFSISSLIPFLSSFGFSVITSYLSSSSNILVAGLAKWNETSANLPTLGVHKVQDDDEKQMWRSNIQTVSGHSPFGFLTALLRLTLSVCRRHKNMIVMLLQPIAQNKDMMVYMKKVASGGKTDLAASHFTMPENLFHYFWLKCCSVTPCLEMDVAHRVALQLLSRLHYGDEHLAHDLLCTAVFSPSFIRESEDVQLASQSLTSLKLTETLYLKSATQEDINVSQGQLLQDTVKALNQIRGHYLMALGCMEKAVQASRNVFVGNCVAVSSLLVKSPDESLMPKDWVFMPLIYAYNAFSQRETSVADNSLSPQTIAKVTSVLQWTLALEIWRPAEMASMSVALKLSRIFCALIAGADLFLEKPVHQYLAGLLRVLCTQRNLDKMDFEEHIPGITSFYDLYQEVLDHYEAASFGDPVFGLFVLLPLQQKHSPLLRRAIWEERRKMLRTLRVPLEELLIPVQNFLQPEETDQRLLQLYTGALATQAVVPSWSPVMYLIAVHHLNRFLYASHDEGNLPLRQSLWKQLLAFKGKMSDVVYYKQYNLSCPNGLELYDQLPINRQKLLDYHMTHYE